MVPRKRHIRPSSDRLADRLLCRRTGDCIGHPRSTDVERREREAQARIGTQRQGTGGGGCVADSAKKVPRAVGGRGAMTSLPERDQVMALVAEAIVAGARQERACEVISLSERTLQRWKNDQAGGAGDRRPARVQSPRNQLGVLE